MPEASFSTATRTGTPRPSTYSRRTRWPGPFGRDHEHVDALGRGDVAEADVEAVAEDQGVAGREVGLDGLGVELALLVVGRQDHDDVGLLHRLGRREDAQALGLGLGAAAWSPRAARRGRRRRSRAATASGRGPGCRSRARPRSCPGSGRGRRRRRRTSRPRWLSFLGGFVLVCGQAGRRTETASGRLGTGTGRRVRSVIERVPRPMATIPDWTSSRMPKGSSTAASRPACRRCRWPRW